MEKNFKYWWERGMQWDAYKELLDNLMLEGKTTGEQQSEELLTYAKMNLQRMKRIDKSFKEDEQFRIFLGGFQGKIKVLAITEGWCGDASQSVPVVANIAKNHADKLELKVILRDEDTELIDQFLTNGGRSIPKFIFLGENNQLLGNWGPRPKVLQEIFIEMKKNNLPFDELSEKLHSWYGKDKARTIQSELMELIKSFNL
ncbi:MAG: thioredoxin family protein [Chitinophagales bacterium]|nr:thioredoxin family protein [Chitinophagales bacterium]